MRTYALLLMLIALPFLAGCQAVQKGVKDITDSLDFEKARAKSNEETTLPTPEAQLKTGIAFHQLHQIRLLLALGHRQLHLAATPLPHPLLNQGLLGPGV